MSTEPAQGEDVDLDTNVRRADPDRWLASRFIGDREARRCVVAVYALDQELARVAPSVSQPLLGEIRFAWWRERITEIAGDAASAGHPVLRALGPAIASGQLPVGLFDALIEARHADLSNTPFTDDADLARYLDGVSGAIMGLAARALDGSAPLRALVEAGRAWGLASLYRGREAWRARGRRWMPVNWGELDEMALGARVAAEVDATLKRARLELAALPVKAFPAVAYATFARPYAHDRPPGELARRFGLLRAVVSGRL